MKRTRAAWNPVRASRKIAPPLDRGHDVRERGERSGATRDEREMTSLGAPVFHI